MARETDCVKYIFQALLFIVFVYVCVGTPCVFFFWTGIPCYGIRQLNSVALACRTSCRDCIPCYVYVQGECKNASCVQIALPISSKDFVFLDAVRWNVVQAEDVYWDIPATYGQYAPPHKQENDRSIVIPPSSSYHDWCIFHTHFMTSYIWNSTNYGLLTEPSCVRFVLCLQKFMKKVKYIEDKDTPRTGSKGKPRTSMMASSAQ